ncbi:uncharacterized protein PADG_12235 [Paracoccidioides brasiliensis Pb18]|uniref:Uncharacterized protein n=1 Tax=Paracoccidioides brasiliensis (strain Pb18) TaxID=502780 RepID=A0A0A0HW81_PARBD|nr:uncharacterized protein PADG_12235 [Paracoccidioides brasiliensis Pb18]KGM91665.1 hypothetical protein PADG_12235 [Paracoccidioides brasiliensis Pb18]
MAVVPQVTPHNSAMMVGLSQTPVARAAPVVTPTKITPRVVMTVIHLTLSLSIRLHELLVITERLSGSLTAYNQQPVTERSVSSTRAGSRQCTCSSLVVPGSSAGQTLGPRLLSPEDISALVSAFAQKLLELRRDSWTGAMDIS